MAAIKTCKETGRSYIQFKTGNPSTSKNSIDYISKVMKKIMQESVAFTGIDITPVFRKPKGEFKLSGRHYIVNAEGDVYYWVGIDTENCRGWSLRIVKLDDDAATALIASPCTDFEIAY